jgi:hypothetical protein
VKPFTACAGAQLRQWYLGGYATGQIQPTNDPVVSNVTAEALPDGGMAATFVQQLPADRDPSDLDLILAAGVVYANGYMRCGMRQSNDLRPCRGPSDLHSSALGTA